QVIAFENVQHLEHHRALSEEAGLVDFVVAISGLSRSFYFGAERREVLRTKQTAVGLAEIRDALCDGSLVEVIARCHQRLMPTARRSRVFGLDDLAQGSGKIGLREHLSRLR